MTDITRLCGGNVCHRLASGLGAIVATCAGARLHANVIKHRRSPCCGGVTLAALIGGGDVRTRLASSLGAVVT